MSDLKSMDLFKDDNSDEKQSENDFIAWPKFDNKPVELDLSRWDSDSVVDLSSVAENPTGISEFDSREALNLGTIIDNFEPITSEKEAAQVCAMMGIKCPKMPWDYFKEETGNKNWVVFSPEMYEIKGSSSDKYLHYKEDCKYHPVLPIGASSCYGMFSQLDVSNISLAQFNTKGVVNMECMFEECSNMDSLDLSMLEMSSVENTSCMFANVENCEISLQNCDLSKVKFAYGMFFNSACGEIDLRGTNFINVKCATEMFALCDQLTYIYTDFNWSENSEIDGAGMFAECEELHNFDYDYTGIEKANHYYGGYFFDEGNSISLAQRDEQRRDY